MPNISTKSIVYPIQKIPSISLVVLKMVKTKILVAKKVEIVKMKNESHLLVTFSKRRVGLFKKANELSILCAVEVDIVVISPGQKVYSFGHHSGYAVIVRFLSHERLETLHIVEANHNANMIELQMYRDQKRGDERREVNKAIQEKYWWMSPFEQLERPQLLQLRSAIEKLKNGMDLEMTTILDANSQQFYVGNSSNQGMIDNDIALDVGYVVPIMMAPLPAYNPDPAEDYMVISAEEYIVNPAEGTNINLVDGDNVNLMGNDILDDALGFGRAYNIIDPEVNNILDVDGFGGYNANPRGNNNYDSLDMVLKGF
ncbi:hypothetical protein GQ457_14G017230 [Hibiscus cannabinus]